MMLEIVAIVLTMIVITTVFVALLNWTLLR